MAKVRHKCPNCGARLENSAFSRLITYDCDMGENENGEIKVYNGNRVDVKYLDRGLYYCMECHRSFDKFDKETKNE